MLEILFKDSAKDITLGQAVECVEHGFYVAVNDGKDITLIIPMKEVEQVRGINRLENIYIELEKVDPEVAELNDLETIYEMAEDIERLARTIKRYSSDLYQEVKNDTVR